MPRSRRAFTLIELLVVIAIIAILAAMLFPVYAQAKVSAKRTVALAQMRQLSISVMMYVQDHDDTFVPSTNYDAPVLSPSRIWTVPLFPYAKSREVFIAPDSRIGRFAEGWANRSEQSVGMNDVLAYSTTLGNLPERICNNGELRFGCSAFWSAASVSQMAEPSKTGVFAVTPDGLPNTKYRGFVFGADNGTIYRDDWVAYTSLEIAVPLASDRDLVEEMNFLGPNELKPIWARFGRTGNDQGQTPVIFGDGHARNYSAASIRNGGSGIVWRFR